MILVTGATGYVGRHLVARLIEQGERPRCLVRDRQRAEKLFPADTVELVVGSTTDAASLKAAVEGIDTIVHAAFMTADRKQSAQNRYAETNIGGTANLITAAKSAGVTRLIELSGLGTKPDTPGSYMHGRFLAEKILIDSGLQWTIIRPSVIFGDHAPFIKALTDLIHTSPVLPLIGGGKVLFQPIYVEDVVTVLTQVIAAPEQSDGKIYTIGGPEYYSFAELFALLTKSMNVKRAMIYAPTPLVRIGAHVMEAVLPHPPLTGASMSLFSFDNTTDLNSVGRDFGFVPFSLKDYLAKRQP